MKRMFIIFLIITQPLFAQKNGIGFNFGTNLFFGDTKLTRSRMPPNICLYGTFRLLPPLSIKAQCGYGKYGINDPSTDVLKTFIPIEITAVIFPFQNKIYQPFLHAGAGVLKYLDDNSSRKKERMYIAGLGVFAAISPNLSFLFSTDLHYLSSDEFNHVIGGLKDSYITFQSGFSFHFGQEQEVNFELSKMGDEEYVLIEPESGMNTNHTAVATNYERQQQMRRDSLKTAILNRNEEIERLKNELNMKTTVIQTIQNELTPFTTPDKSVEELYQQARDKYQAKEFESVISLLTNLLRQYPAHQLAANFHYWIGESYFGMGRYPIALESFLKVLTYDRSYKTDDALLMSGICYRKLEEHDKSRAQFQELLERFPKSEFTSKAKRFLN
jgi:tol-pal system protein YbgF